MKKLNEVKVVFKIEFDYTDTVNQAIEENQVKSIKEIKEMLFDWIVEDVQEAGVEPDNVTITIDRE
jgi:hypothetical protein